jgi:hypothetical protein
MDTRVTLPSRWAGAPAGILVYTAAQEQPAVSGGSPPSLTHKSPATSQASNIAATQCIRRRSCLWSVDG